MKNQNRKQIGIITFHKALNYGGVFQNYALQKKLISMGYDAETIDYNSKCVYEIYNNFYVGKFNIIKTPIKFLLNIIYYKDNNKMKKNFENFVKNNIKLSQPVNRQNIKDYCNKYDFIISGSDQVWNKDLTKSDYDIYDLSFLNQKNKIAYAASIGKDNISECEINYYRNLIKQYKSVSVRENSINKMLKIDSLANVLDPVYFLSKDEWKKIVNVQQSDEKYVFIFSLERNKDIENIIDNLSQKHKIYYYTKVPLIKKNVKCILGIKPVDFLSMIYNAEFIVTNSFHCLSFSILFNKKFMTILHKNRSSRQKDLLKLFSLEDRIYNGENDIDLFSKEIDYKNVNQIIENERKKSEEFIKNSIER